MEEEIESIGSGHRERVTVNDASHFTMDNNIEVPNLNSGDPLCIVSSYLFHSIYQSVKYSPWDVRIPVKIR